MNLFSKYRYYFSSLFTLGWHVRNWGVFAQVLRGTPAVLHLRSGLRFQVRSLMDVWVIKETCVDGDYEFDEAESGVIVDIGAGLGDYAILKAAENESNKIYALEPFADSFELLKTNIALNEVNNVVPLPLAISGTTGELLLEATGEAVQHTTTSSTVAGRSSGVLHVQAKSLDDFFAEQQIETCVFLKVDCEGSEFDILFNSSAETLARIKRIGLEFHNGYTAFNDQDLANFLERHGFAVTRQRNPVHGYLGLIFAKR